MNYFKWFGRNDRTQGRYYVDYCIEEIKKKHSPLPQDEQKLIQKARRKYKIINALNLAIFILGASQIYKYGLLAQKSAKIQNELSPFKKFPLNILTYSIIMIFIYMRNQVSYFKDLKFLLKKYSYFTPEEMAKYELNRKIIELYDEKKTV
jgi:hypothetical protein